MSRIGIIAWHEYVTNVRRPGFIFFTLLIPALEAVTLAVLFFFSGQATRIIESQFTPERTTIGIVDDTRLFTPLPPEFAIRFAEYTSEQDARKALLDGRVGGYAVIPPDYMDTGRVTIYAGEKFGNIALADSAVLRSLLVNGLLKDKVDASLLKRVSNPASVALVTVDSRGNPTTASPLSFVSGYLAPYFLSLFLVISIFVSSGYLLRSVSEEKESRVIEILLSSVSPTQLLAGKVVGLGVLGLTQVTIWLVSAFAVTGSGGLYLAGGVISLNPATFLLATLYFILGYIVFGIIMAAAGALGTNLRESQQLAGLFSFAAAIPYMVGGFIFANPNAMIARILSYFPLTAPTMMMLRLPLGAVPTEDIVGSIVVLLITIPFVLWAGAKSFRMGLLMYGKRPSLGEIARMLARS